MNSCRFKVRIIDSVGLHCRRYEVFMLHDVACNTTDTRSRATHAEYVRLRICQTVKLEY